MREPYPLSPIPYSLFPIPYSLFPIPYSLFPIPYSLFPIPLLPLLTADFRRRSIQTQPSHVIFMSKYTHDLAKLKPLSRSVRIISNKAVSRAVAANVTRSGS
jgi:hypothetical protein